MSGRAGFSVVEALVAAALAGIALAGLAGVSGLATRSLRLARDNGSALALSNERLEALRVGPRLNGEDQTVAPDGTVFSRSWSHAGGRGRPERLAGRVAWGDPRARARHGGDAVSGCRGTGLVELLVGMALALVVLSALTAAFAAGVRLLVACGARGEAEDTVQLAIEAFTFDARRAGYDPAAAGISAVTEAAADHVTFIADLDGDGVIDANSEETTTHRCLPASARLSRVIGQQSMPLADRVTSCGFRYLDADGAPIAVPAGGLDAAGRSRVRGVALHLVLLPTGLAGPAERGLLVALRSGA